MTQAEAIRQMDDSQLADLLCSFAEGGCNRCPFANKEDRTYPLPCGAMDYLHREVIDERSNNQSRCREN